MSMLDRVLENLTDTVILQNPLVFKGTVTKKGGTFGGIKTMVYEALGTAIAAKTFSIAVNVPTGARIIGTQLKVMRVLVSSDGGTAFSAAFATGSTQACGTAVAYAAGTTQNTFFNPNAATPVTSAVTTITITGDSSKTFAAGGTVRAIVYADVFVT